VLDVLQEEDTILLDDGKIELKMKQGLLQVVRGGVLSSRKSVKITGKDILLPALTAEDRINLSQAKQAGVRAVMQPFVRSAKDIHAVRAELARNGCEDIRIFSKIENRTGLAHLDEIIPASDMIVIARGDLGNDIPLPQLPGVQKDIARRCLYYHVPFLVVTQMLSSMIHSPIPTRAEVSDIFNAVTDGAGAVMVTNETAAGDYPVAVMKVLSDTGNAAEAWLKRHRD
jgi:pyruvate kinase